MYSMEERNEREKERKKGRKKGRKKERKEGERERGRKEGRKEGKKGGREEGRKRRKRNVKITVFRDSSLNLPKVPTEKILCQLNFQSLLSILKKESSFFWGARLS